MSMWIFCSVPQYASQKWWRVCSGAGLRPSRDGSSTIEQYSLPSKSVLACVYFVYDVGALLLIV